MKIRALFAVLSLLAGNSEARAEFLPSGSADTAYATLAAFQTEVLAGPPAEIKGDAVAYRAWAVPRQGKLTLMRFEFAQRFTAHPKHWAAMLEAAWTGSYSQKMLEAYGKDHPEDAPDLEALRQWAGPALAMLESDPAVPLDINLNLRMRRGTIEISEQEGLAVNGKQPNWKKAAAILDGIAERSPDFSRTYLEQRLAKLMVQYDPPAGTARLQQLIDNPNSNPSIRAMAQTELAANDAMRRPLELHFTAVDGREVDLEKLRGKVVLVDFWATWCVPCVAELPNVKAAYTAYHDKGFEVIGIALENGETGAKDTPDPADEKFVKARKVLTDFTAKHELPWPQYFDGKYWKTEPAAKFAINSIPAMFLLDQDSKIVSTNARGEKLEAEVKRLLKL